MLRLTKAQREWLADKLADLANLAAAGLVLGELLGDGPVSITLLAFAASAWIWLTLMALVTAGGAR